MYCRKCGNKLLNSDNFCSECGTKVTDEETEVLEKLIHEENTPSQKEQPNLPMNWFNFWQYFRLPVGFVISILNLLFSYESMTMNFFALVILLINIFLIILIGSTLYAFSLRKRSGYYMILTLLPLQTAWNIFVSAFDTFDLTNFYVFLILLAFFSIVWICPNYIYFQKRKDFFCN